MKTDSRNCYEQFTLSRLLEVFETGHYTRKTSRIIGKLVKV